MITQSSVVDPDDTLNNEFFPSRESLPVPVPKKYREFSSDGWRRVNIRLVSKRLRDRPDHLI